MSNNTMNLIDEQIIQRVNDVLDIKNLFGRHAYCHAFGLHVKELDEYWVKKPDNQATASFGQSWCFNVGMDRIDRYYGRGHVESAQRELDELCKEDPTIENKPENRGIGMMLIHALTTPCIEIADDGKTAQGMWYAPGQVSGPKMVAHMDEKYAVDFIKEDGEWKIWHMFVGTDYSVRPGGDLGEQDTPLEREQKGGAPMMPRGEPDEGYIPMDAYSMKFNVPSYPPMPTPYYTFKDTVSYGPEGHPNYRKEGK